MRTTLMAAGVAAVVVGGVRAASGQTDVPAGPLATQTWTLQGSPYRLTGDVSVGEFATLTIEPGVEVVMAPGDVLFFNGSVVHGSKPNRSRHARRVFINGYAYPGANRRVYPGEGAGRKLVVEP